MNPSTKYGESPLHDIAKQKAKRRKGRRDSYTRFSSAENEMLLEGIQRYGAGNWKRILCAYDFHEKRTAVDLKDKYRNILRAEERERWSKIQQVTYNNAAYHRKTVVNLGGEWKSGVSEMFKRIPGQTSMAPTARKPVPTTSGHEGWGGVDSRRGLKRPLLHRFSPFLFSSSRDGIKVDGKTRDAEKRSGIQRTNLPRLYGREGIMSSRDMQGTDVGCGARAAMRLERLLCPAEKTPQT